MTRKELNAVIRKLRVLEDIFRIHYREDPSLTSAEVLADLKARIDAYRVLIVNETDKLLNQ